MADQISIFDLNIPVKPNIESKYGIPFRACCGECGGLIFTAGRYYTIDDARDRVKVCKHCGRAVKWNG